MWLFLFYCGFHIVVVVGCMMFSRVYFEISLEYGTSVVLQIDRVDVFLEVVMLLA